MSVFKAEQVCIFSAMSGIITYQGKPASGATIIRKVNWKDETGEREITTSDAQGHFEFSSLWDSINPLKRILPSQFVAYQSIFVSYQGVEYQVWGGGKMEREEFSEFGGRPKNLRCELTDEPRRVELKHGAVGTACTWDIEDQEVE